MSHQNWERKKDQVIIRRGRRREIAKESQRWLEEQIWRMKEMEEGSEAGGKGCDEQRRKNSFVSEDHSPL